MMRPLVIDRLELTKDRNTDGPRRDKDWWAQCSAEELQEEVSRMTTRENEALVSELNAAIASTGPIVTDPDADSAWRDRARRALVHMRRGRAIVAAELKKRLDASAVENRTERERIVAQAKECVADNNLAGAIMLMLTWIEGFGKKSTAAHRKGDDDGK